MRHLRPLAVTEFAEAYSGCEKAPRATVRKLGVGKGRNGGGTDPLEISLEFGETVVFDGLS